MKEWKAFLPRVLPLAISCPKQVALDAIKDSAIDFCRQTQVWQQTLDSTIYFPSGVATVDLDVPAGAYVTSIVWLKDEGGNLCFPGENYTASATQITLVEVPRASAQYQARVALAPARTATSVPDFLFDEWAAAVADGALTSLLSMVGREWANPGAVAYHADKFEAAQGRARRQVMSHGANASHRVQPRIFL